jgi:hypothetical protein
MPLRVCSSAAVQYGSSAAIGVYSSSYFPETAEQSRARAESRAEAVAVFLHQSSGGSVGFGRVTVAMLCVVVLCVGQRFVELVNSRV